MCWKSTIVLSTPKPAFFHVSFGFLFRFWPILKLRSQVLVLCSFVCTKRQVYSINFFYLSEWNLNPVISMWHWNGKRDLCYPCCRMQHKFSVIHHLLTVNAKYKNATQNARMQRKIQKCNTECKNAVENTVRTDFNSAKHQPSQLEIWSI